MKSSKYQFIIAIFCLSVCSQSIFITPNEFLKFTINIEKGQWESSDDFIKRTQSLLLNKGINPDSLLLLHKLSTNEVAYDCDSLQFHVKLPFYSYRRPYPYNTDIPVFYLAVDSIKSRGTNNKTTTYTIYLDYNMNDVYKNSKDNDDLWCKCKSFLDDEEYLPCNLYRLMKWHSDYLMDKSGKIPLCFNMEKEMAKGFITSKTNSLAIVFLCKLLSPRFYYKIKNVNIDIKSYVLDVGIIDILLVNTTANIILGSFNNSLNNITLPIISNTNKH